MYLWEYLWSNSHTLSTVYLSVVYPCVFITQTFPYHLLTFTPSQRCHCILPQLSIDDSCQLLMSEGLSKVNHNTGPGTSVADVRMVSVHNFNSQNSRKSSINLITWPFSATSNFVWTTAYLGVWIHTDKSLDNKPCNSILTVVCLWCGLDL